ncbi:MAG: TetR/AcrR family transcriptional regulator [Pseudomonadota bacterium]|nr:TetR/AcrR family transcriptional regulator [Pseudomonadota bacterium]
MPSVRSRVAKLPTRSLILNEVERLIARRGVYGFTLQDVAAPLGVQVPAIYKHFKGRDDVLIELSRRFIEGLSRQFAPAPRAGSNPLLTLKRRLDEFVDFHLDNPAYVRLSLVDFATPQGGMEYLSLASGGPLHETPHVGPLASMHRHLAALLEAARTAGQCRAVAPLDFYLLVKSVLLIRLVFRDDRLLTGKPSRARVAETKAALWDVAWRYLAPNP